MAQKEAHSVAITSFDLNHNDYDTFRPSFLKELVDPFLVQLGLGEYNETQDKYTFHTDKTIVEIAAGTGKFTKNIVDHGWDNSNPSNPDNLIVVEPSKGMLESFRKNFPQLNTKNIHQATSYQLPLADNSADAVIIAQGFHWFSDLVSLKEIARILKPKGKLGLIWNLDYASISQNCPIEKTKFFDGGSLYFHSLNFNEFKNAQDVFENYFDNQPWSKKVTELIYEYDLGVPQYRHGKWREVLEDGKGTDFSPILSESFVLYDKLIAAEDVYKYWETRSYITELSDKQKKTIKEEIERIIKENAGDASRPYSSQGENRLLKPMATHAVVLEVNK
ncbi:methyltransferase [Scheffersomyces xylosifermentans]|uniref:methyltransferase n=1 Tax=Scheffersomyces xylosifermentans TaxID=1304137 RepID=UPI00315DAC2C